MKFYRKNTRNCFGRTYLFRLNCSSDKRWKCIISGSLDKTIRIWNLFEKRQEALLKGHSRVNSLAVTADNQSIVSDSDDKKIRIWSLLEKRQEAILEGHTKSVCAVAVTSDNKYIVSGSEDMKIGIWNLLEKTQDSFLKRHGFFINNLAAFRLKITNMLFLVQEIRQ